ncbi:hypothetical protein HYW39_02700 [Candidatus Curtissbacteria bacterium]|nr:hypothetical protein [Candidatus Curtissbacteria bacterium]
MDLASQKQKIEAAYSLLSAESTTVEKFDSASKLLAGINPKIDKKLQVCAEALLIIANIQRGEIIDLSARNLPEKTEEQKKRKRAILAFIKTFKELKGEVERVKKELQNLNQSTTTSLGRIAALAKGPFGLITALALVIVLAIAFMRGNQPQTRNQIQTATVSPQATPSPTPALSPATTPIPKSTIQVITFSGKKIPLAELDVRTGPDCTNSPRQAPHYHAKNGQSAKALDGTIIPDPGACAYGKVEETQVQEVESP